MTDFMKIYHQEAQRYDQLIAREDAGHNILPAIHRITPLKDKNILELGAGTGRLTCLLAPLARAIHAFDISLPMLEVATRKLRAGGWMNWTTAVGDHRSLPLNDGGADIAISGWSICHLVDFHPDQWEIEVGKALSEMHRGLCPGGSIIILETQGTGYETPHPPDHLLPYFQFLADQGFTSTWIRTDYQFQSVQEAVAQSRFFFGEPLASQVQAANSTYLPECTGIWWKMVA